MKSFILILLLLASSCTSTKTVLESYSGKTIGPGLEGWGRPDSITPINDRLTKLTWSADKFVVDRWTKKKNNRLVPNATLIIVIEEPNQAGVNAKILKFIEENRITDPEDKQIIFSLLGIKYDANENAFTPVMKYGINVNAIIRVAWCKDCPSFATSTKVEEKQDKSSHNQYGYQDNPPEWSKSRSVYQSAPSPLKIDAYGPGIHMDQYGRPVRLQPDFGGVQGEMLQIKPDAYGPGIHMDQYGRPVRQYPWP